MFHLVSLLVDQEDLIYTINRSVLQENGILLGGCLTMKNKWEVNHTTECVTDHFNLVDVEWTILYLIQKLK